jgi:hypothetical protein
VNEDAEGNQSKNISLASTVESSPKVIDIRARKYGMTLPPQNVALSQLL